MVSYRLDKAMERYSSPLENIIITKEEFYTNVIITEIESNKFITNNIILKSSSIEDLQNAFAEAIDSHTKNLQISMSEIVKSSSDTLNFWFAFISVVMIVFIGYIKFLVRLYICSNDSVLICRSIRK